MSNWRLMFNLFKLYILLHLLNKSYTRERAAGGAKCDKEAYKFMVTLTYNHFDFCGGSLLNEKYVLTAAYCVDRRSIWQVIVKMYDKFFGELKHGYQRESGIEEYIIHPKYVSFPHLFNDIGLIKLKEAFPKGNEVTFITLPKPGCTIPIQEICIEGDVMSWALHYIAYGWSCAISVIPNGECEKLFITKKFRDKPLRHQFCTYSEEKKLCQKDQGSAIICNGVQIGIASIVDKVSCYKGEVPTGFTRIDCYLKFIYTSMLNSGGEKYVANSGISLNDANLEVDYDLSDIQVYTCRNFTYERMCLSDRTIQKSSENGKKGESEHGSTGSTDGCSGSEDRYSSRSEDGYSRSEDGYSRSEDGYSRSDRDSGDGDRNSRDENKVIDMNKGSNFLKISTFGMILQLSLVSLISFSSSFILLTIVF